LDGEGYFAMPLIGEVLAGGRTARQVETEVEVALKSGGYLVEPQVSIEVLNYRPFYIIGEVNNPGSFAYVSGMTVINAVALAGGYTYRADQDDIIISRGGSTGPKIQAMPDTEVLPGDIVEVTERFF
jgi:polysaccharide export outer membrane protein